MTLLDKMADGKGIFVSVTAGKTLIRHVEESKVPLLLDDTGHLLPLLRGRVDAGRIVGTGVEEEDTAQRRSLEVSHHALKIKADRVLVVVAILLDFEAGVGEDGFVVGP